MTILYTQTNLSRNTLIFQSSILQIGSVTQHARAAVGASETSPACLSTDQRRCCGQGIHSYAFSQLKSSLLSIVLINLDQPV